jgi:hypothetical protein
LHCTSIQRGPVTIALFAGILATASPGSAYARPQTPAELLKKAAAAATGGRHEACAEAYAAALTLDPAYTTAAELGICEEALGRFVAAYDHLIYALEGEPPNAVKGARQWKRYHAALERVSQRVARAIVSVRPNAAEVFVDGRSLGRFVSGRIFALLPGEHTWSATLEGYQGDAMTHRPRAGDVPDIALELREQKAAPPAALPQRATSGNGSAATSGNGSAATSGNRSPAPPRAQPACGDRIREKLQHESGSWYPGGHQDPALALLAGGLMSAGFTADLGAGLWLGGEARFRDTERLGGSLGLETRALLPAKAGARPDGRGLGISLVGGALVPCLRYGWALGCAVVDVGVAIASGPGLLSPPGGPFSAALGIGPRLAISLPISGRVGVRVFADLRFSPLSQAAGYRHDGAAAWHDPPLSAVFGLGLSLRSPGSGPPH